METPPSTAPTETWRDDLRLDTPDQVVDFIASVAHDVVDKANAGRSGDEEQYRAAIARTFDAITSRLLAHPDAGFTQRLRRTLPRADHRLPTQTRARLRTAPR
ncbi:hypothetical protein BKG82_27180 [Mycobacteroides chelonae]|uniref:Uncharacterized protein n=1 Tax=Mycobacteroides chelonae TaxID=1774 RepID=A0A1S1LD41_MYCCH|nr:hypothetical protein [Mycobacteroides chelonae]OHU47338.1 hypothetical protein BKG82_27180 [Mycobacteroides chelonae]